MEGDKGAAGRTDRTVETTQHVLIFLGKPSTDRSPHTLGQAEQHAAECAIYSFIPRRGTALVAPYLIEVRVEGLRAIPLVPRALVTVSITC